MVAEGATVARGDVIASIATEKSDIDIEAYASGVLRKILIQPGVKVPVGQAIAIIADPSEELTEDEVAGENPPPATALEAAAEPGEQPPSGDGDQAQPQGAMPPAEAEDAGRAPTPVPDWARPRTRHAQG